MSVSIHNTNNHIEGRLLCDKQAKELQLEIESNYINGDLTQHFNRQKDDIRMHLFNFDTPLCQRVFNGITLKITMGLIRNKRKTYLLYADGKIIGEFYSVNVIKILIKYIEYNSIIINNNALTIGTEPLYLSN